MLFDPVAQDAFSANLQAIAGGGARPVLSVAARPALINLYNNSFGALKALPNPFVGVQLVWSGYAFGFPYSGSCHTDAEGENGDVIGNLAAGCTPSTTQVGRLRDLGATWVADLAAGTRNPAYYCTNAAVRSTCGSKIAALVSSRPAQASLIPVA